MYKTYNVGIFNSLEEEGAVAPFSYKGKRENKVIDSSIQIACYS